MPNNITNHDPKDLQTILKINGYKPHQTSHLNVTKVVPKELDFIWNSFSDGAPFSFGDSNYTLVDAHTIRDWVEELYELGINDLTPAKWKKAEKALGKFIDLMNLCYDAGVYINVE